MRTVVFLLLPRGRIGRAEFWIGLFFHIWVLRWLAVPQAVMALAAGVLPAHIGWLGALLTVVDVWLLWCHFAKRWHDMNFAAAWTLGLFVPALGPTIGFLALGFIPGSRGLNRYGAPRPLRATLDELAADLNRTGRVAPLADPIPAVASSAPIPVPARPEASPMRRPAATAKAPPPIARRDAGRPWGARSLDPSPSAVVVRRRR